MDNFSFKKIMGILGLDKDIDIKTQLFGPPENTSIDKFNFLQQNRPNNKLFNNIISNITDREVEYINYDCECLSGVAGIIDTIPKDNMMTYYENDIYTKCYIYLHNIKIVKWCNLFRETTTQREKILTFISPVNYSSIRRITVMIITLKQ
jgi:hypothetical protein